jgi:hypothetical protein
LYFNSLTAPFIFDDEVAVANPAIDRSAAHGLSRVIRPRRPSDRRPLRVNFAASDGSPGIPGQTSIHRVRVGVFGLLRRTLLLA